MSTGLAPISAPISAPRVTQARITLGEWIKLRTAKTNRITLLAGGAVTVIFGVIFSAAVSSGTAAGPLEGISNPVDISLRGTFIAQLVMGTLGVLLVAGEYSTGLIRTTMAAVGSRVGLVAAKVTVVGASVFSVMFVACTLAVLAGQAVYSGDEATSSLADPDVWRVIIGTSAYVTAVALIGVALGFILRSTASAIGTLVGCFFIFPTLSRLLPDAITDNLLKFFPTSAGDSLTAMNPGADLLSPGMAAVTLAVWVIGLLGLAVVLVRRRDA
jgi:ABC-2 type transport system permease protein